MSLWRQNAIARRSCLASPQLAAYRLGFQTRAIRCFQEYYWDNGEDYNRGVDGALAKLQATRIPLADTICPAVATELRIVVRRLSRHNARIKRAAALGRYRGLPFGKFLVPGEVLWLTLCSLADQALPNDAACKSLYDLGAVLGDFYLAVCQLAGACEDCDLRRIYNHFDPLASLCIDSPKGPLLAELFRLKTEVPSLTPESFLDHLRIATRADGPGEDAHNAEPLVVSNVELAEALNTAFEHALRDKADPAYEPAIRERKRKRRRKGVVTKETLQQIELQCKKKPDKDGLLIHDQTIYREGFEPVRIIRKKPWSLLMALYRRIGQVCDRNYLIDALWEGGDRSDLYVLKSTLGELLRPMHMKIATEVNHGYRLEVLP